MSETWIKEWCSKCSAVNWFYLGKYNIEACECHKCGHRWWTAEDEDNACMQGCEVSELPALLKSNDIDVEKGIESPE